MKKEVYASVRIFLILIVTLPFYIYGISAFAHSCVTVRNLEQININPNVKHPISSDESVTNVLKNAETSLLGYIDINFMSLINRLDKNSSSSSLGFSKCPKFDSIPVYLDEKLKYIPLIFKTEDIAEETIKMVGDCIGQKNLKLDGYFARFPIEEDKYPRPDRFPYKFNSLKIFKNEDEVKKNLHRLYDSDDFEEHSKRCKVKISGKFLVHPRISHPKLFFEVKEIEIIEKTFSKIQANIKLRHVELIKKWEEDSSCREAITSTRLYGKIYRFWNTRFDFKTVLEVKEKGYSCGLTLEASEASEKALKSILCECAKQRKKGKANKFTVWKKQFVHTCQNKVEYLNFSCKGYN